MQTNYLSTERLLTNLKKIYIYIHVYNILIGNLCFWVCTVATIRESSTVQCTLIFFRAFVKIGLLLCFTYLSVRIILYGFSENGQYLLNNWDTGFPCNNRRCSNENVNRSNLKRSLLHEFRMKELNERLKQIMMFNKQNEKKQPWTILDMILIDALSKVKILF